MSKRLIIFTDRQEEMIEEIISKKGYNSVTAVIHQGIISLHSKLIPEYTKNNVKESPEERLGRIESNKKAKENQVKKEYIAILEELGGEIVEENGKEFAVYHTYIYDKKYLQKVPLQMLSSDILKTQYQPDKKTVEKLLAKKNK